jgi:hypothetical protein
VEQLLKIVVHLRGGFARSRIVFLQVTPQRHSFESGMKPRDLAKTLALEPGFGLTQLLRPLDRFRIAPRPQRHDLLNHRTDLARNGFRLFSAILGPPATYQKLLVVTPGVFTFLFVIWERACGQFLWKRKTGDLKRQNSLKTLMLLPVGTFDRTARLILSIGRNCRRASMPSGLKIVTIIDFRR